MQLLKPIIGDICGSIYEWTDKVSERPKELMLENCTFTDDTVCTIAIADAINNDFVRPDFDRYLNRWFMKYPNRGYGKRFVNWCLGEGPGDSYGNGCCMRMYPISIFYTEPFIRMSKLADSCAGSHRHQESFYAMFRLDAAIHKVIESRPYKGYFEDIRKQELDATCAKTVDVAIAIGSCAESFEDCIKDAIYVGGDTDTIACMACMVTEHNPSKELEDWAMSKLPIDMRKVIEKFEEQ